MNIEILKRTIGSSGSSLRLALDELGSPAFAATLSPYLPDKILRIRNIQQWMETEDSISISGTGEDPPFSGMETTAVFSTAISKETKLPEATVLITAKGHRDWTLATSFPALQHSAVNDVSFAPHPTLHLSSHKVSDEINEGMYFEGLLDLGSALGKFGFLFEDVHYKISGVIYAMEGVPDMALLGPVNASLQLGCFQLSNVSCELYSDVRYNTAYLEWEADAYIGISADISLRTRHEVYTIPLLADIYDPQNSVLFVAQLEEGMNAALDELSALVNGLDLAIPADQLEIAEAIRLTDLKVLVNPANPKLIDYVALSIETANEWTLVEDLLELQAIDVLFRVDDPLSKPRLGGVVSGLIGIGKTGTLELSAFFEDFAFGGGLREGDPLKITEVFEHFMPAPDVDLPDLYLTKFNFEVHPATATFSGEIVVDGRWGIPGLPDCYIDEVWFSLNHSEAAGDTAFRAGGVFAVADIPIYMEAEYGGADNGWTFAGGTDEGATIPIGALIEDIATLFGPVSLPSILTGLTLEELEVSFNTRRSAFTYTGTSKFPVTDREIVGITLRIAVARGVDGATNSGTSCAISMRGEGPLHIADQLALAGIDFDFDLTEDGDWSVSGSMAGRLFDKEIELSAAYEQTETGKKLRLASAITSPTKLVDIAGVGSFDLSRLVLELEKEQTGGEAAMGWSVVADGGLKVEQLFDFQGHLELYKRKDGAAGLIFKPEVAAVSLPLPVPPAKLELSFGGLSIVRTGSEAGGDWSFEASVTAACPVFHQALPANVRALFPEQITARFKADNTAVTLSADRILNPIDVPLPDLDVGGQSPIPLGILRLDASNLAIRIDKEITLSTDFGLGLPQGLNNIFGVKKGVTPPEASVELFNTFDPQDPDSTTLRFELSVGTAGLKVVPQSSPIKAVELAQRGGKTWWDIDLGDFGAATVQVPELSFDAASSSFQASGGFEITRPLSLPLTPIKAVLTAFGLQPAADLLPDRLPLEDLSLLDENDDFKADEMIALLDAGLPGDLPRELKDAITVFGYFVNKLPDRFRNYLNVRVPESFFFDVAITPDGSLRLDVGVKEGGQPVKLLLPTLQGLEGIELHGISVGTLLGNNLILVRADLRIDEFDLITLAGSLLLPDDEQFPLPRSQDLQRRLIIDNLVVIVIPHTQVPIPVPLFYDELGIEYWGLEGVQLQAHVKFPQPQLDLKAFGKALADFVRFLSDREALLDPEALGKMDVRFALGRTYLQLPEYLGDEVLGHKGADLEVKAYATIANVLNFLKTLTPNRLIQAIPVEHRVGTVTVGLGPMSASATWLMTTPDEFRQAAYRQLSLARDQTGSFLAVLPRVPDVPAGAGEEGLVVFLRGTWAVADLADFDAVFGLAASGSMGFHTGFKIAGNIAGFMDAEIAGRVSITPPPPETAAPAAPVDRDAVFRLAGHSHLTILDHHVFRGDVQIVDRDFYLKGQLTLFPPGFPLQVDGDVEGRLNDRELYLAGAVRAALGDFTLAGARALVTNRRVYLEGTWLGVTTALDIETSGGAWAMRGAVAVDLWGLKAYAAIAIDGATGKAVVQGEVAPIDLGIFKLTGAGGPASRPSFQMQLRSGRVSRMDVSGAVSLLGLSTSTLIQVREQTFQLRAEGRIFGLFTCRLEVSGSSLAAGGGFYVRATLENDFFLRLKEDASNLIRSAADEAVRPLEEARRKLTQAQAEVAKIQGGIDACKRRIHQLESEIASWQGWFDRLAWYDKVWGWIKLGVETGWRAVEIAAQYVAIGAQEVVKLTALGVLEVAKLVLRTLELSIRAAADVGSFILTQGLDAVLSVESASFEGRLDALTGGSVSLATTIRFMGGAPQRLELGFNLLNPAAGARQLQQKLLPAPETAPAARLSDHLR